MSEPSSSPLSGSSPNTGTSFRVIIYAGPTGGHLYPALAFADAFLKKFPDSKLHFVTCDRAKPLVEKMPQGIFHEVHFLPEFGFPGGFSWKTLRPFFLMPVLFLKAFFQLRRIRPHLCVGFGSFVSYPGMRVAHLLGFKTLIHEQNMIPGKATLWLVPHMDVVAESFEQTKLLKKARSLFAVGLPLRSALLQSIRSSRLQAAPRPFTVLVIGGSQGSHGLNRIVADAIEQLSDEERSKMAVIHITGSQDQTWISERYKKIAFSCEVYSFYSAMQELFQRADLVIARAGANTLFELAAYGLPALVIPYPHAGGHQVYNASSFAKTGGLLYYEENQNAVAWLTEHLKAFSEKPELLQPMAQAIKKMAKPDAAEALVAIAEGLIKQK